VRRGRAVGVETESRRGERRSYRAPLVVSGVGAYNTYQKLLDVPAASGRLRQLAAEAPTTVVAYLGFGADPRKLGFAGENHWISESYDHERHAAGEGLCEGRPLWCYLSFPSLKSGEEEPVHTAEIMAFVGRDTFDRWGASRWMRRGDDYTELKETIADGLLALVERHYPGFRALVRYVELSSPLSVEHFTGSPFGAVYGLPATPDRFREPLCSARTAIENLYLTGSDAFLYGIVGAALSGAVTVGAIRGGSGFLGVMKAVTGARSWRGAVGL
jgi:all-trans-retinol 13,14-reductase